MNPGQSRCCELLGAVSSTGVCKATGSLKATWEGADNQPDSKSENLPEVSYFTIRCEDITMTLSFTPISLAKTLLKGVFALSAVCITMQAASLRAYPSQTPAVSSYPSKSSVGSGITEETDTLTTILPGLEVSATASEETKSTVPVFAIESTSLSAMGIESVTDALKRMPGVSIKDYGGAGGMKTVAVRGMGAQHTGVAYDGVVLSDARSGQIDLGRYSLENLADLSLTIGDGDAIFIPARNCAFPALLDISTLSPSAKGGPKVKAQFTFGSWQLLGGYLRWEQNLSNKFTLAATADFQHAKNDYPFRLRNLNLVTHERRDNSKMEKGYGEIHALFRPSAATSISAKVHYYDNDRQLPGQVRYYTNFSRETLHDRNFFAQAGLRTSFGQNLRFRAELKYNWEASRYRDPSYPGGVRDADYYQREAYATFSMLYTPHSYWAFNYSGDYFFNNLDSWQNPGQTIAVNPRPVRNSVVQSLTARFSNGRLSATARLLLSLYYTKAETANARDARRLSPSVSASWKVLDEHELYLRASYKNIFRMPTFSELYFFHFGASDLRPENTDQLNLGVTWEERFDNDSRLRITADGYLNHIKDMIVAVPYNMFIWTNINLGKVTSRGVDVTLSFSQPLGKRQSIELEGNWSWQRSANRTDRNSPYWGNQPAYIPVNSGAGSVCWKNPWVNAALSATATSGRWTTSEHFESTRVGGFADFNLTLFRELHLKRCQFELRGDIRNLLNRRYEIVRLYPMPGINYRVTLGFRFE